MHSWMLQGLAVGCLLTAATAVAQKETSEAAPASTAATGESHLELAAGSSPESTPTRLPSKFRGTPMAETPASHAFVTVGGQVQSPGPVTVGKSSTLESVIDRAGGATPFGALHRVRVTRGKHVIEINLNTSEGRSFRVQCKDVIEIPQKMVFGR